jgi:hypothetical protein
MLQSAAQEFQSKRKSGKLRCAAGNCFAANVCHKIAPHTIQTEEI